MAMSASTMTVGDAAEEELPDLEDKDVQKATGMMQKVFLKKKKAAEAAAAVAGTGSRSTGQQNEQDEKKKNEIANDANLTKEEEEKDDDEFIVEVVTKASAGKYQTVAVDILGSSMNVIPLSALDASDSASLTALASKVLKYFDDGCPEEDE